MIGTMEVGVEILPRTGDRVDTIATVKGPGETEYSFPLSISGTIQAIWGIRDEDVEETLKSLVYEMFSSIVGTASGPPQGGYWFDSYNSESTIKATLDRMRNLGQTSYLKDPSSRDQISAIYGGGILREIERVSGVFAEATTMRLINPLDYSFDRSQAEADLGTAPSNNAEFLYRICILSVIIDGFGVRRDGENERTPSLQALENWLTNIMSREDARKITEPFARVKDLRKQYPIHEHFEATASGQRVVRDEVRAAEEYYGFQAHFDYAAKWKKVTDSFKEAIQELEAVATQANPIQQS